MTKEELRDYVEEQRSLNMIPYHVYSALIDGIDTLEQEPKTGHWIEGTNKYGEKTVYCSECKNKAPYVFIGSNNHYGGDIHGEHKKTNYCPNCGIKMVEPQESEKV